MSKVARKGVELVVLCDIGSKYNHLLVCDSLKVVWRSLKHSAMCMEKVPAVSLKG